MKISLNWLKTYIKTDLPAEEIARILTGIGLEVEALEKIESIRGGLAGLVIGEVLTCEKHPDADKLHVTTVDLGDGVPTQIVCGAPERRCRRKSGCRYDQQHTLTPPEPRTVSKSKKKQDSRSRIVRYALCRG